jgi:hypothetical protein
VQTRLSQDKIEAIKMQRRHHTLPVPNYIIRRAILRGLTQGLVHRVLAFIQLGASALSPLGGREGLGDDTVHAAHASLAACHANCSRAAVTDIAWVCITRQHVKDDAYQQDVEQLSGSVLYSSQEGKEMVLHSRLCMPCSGLCA